MNSDEEGTLIASPPGEPSGTPLVRLRPIALSDREPIRSWRNLPEVAQYMYSDHTITAGEHEDWFERIRKDPSCRYWVIEHHGQGVGVANLVHLDRRNSRCHWAFYVAEDESRRKGVGAVAEYLVIQHVFVDLGLHKLCGEVLDFNERVLKLHDQFGFRQEGVLREHVKKGERYFDVVQIALLRDDWLAREPAVRARLVERGWL